MTTHAFTLGVNTYKDPLIPPLGCCERDAREFNGLLKERFGFDAHYLEERFTEPIEERIESLGKHLKPGDVFIFYFSGHGKAHQDDHYLLLPGARLAAFESGAVAVSGVLSYRNLKHITSGGNWRGVHRLFIIDACRSHLTSKKSVGEPVSFDGEYLLKDPRRGARRQEPGDENLTLLNSCALGACAVELPGEGHGIFTAALLDLMRGRQGKGAQDGLVIDPGFVTTLGETMTAKASRVGLPPEVLHQPALVGEGLRLVSDFPDAAPVDDSDEVDWVLAKAKDTLEALESYVRSHPRGTHVKEAVARIAELSRQVRDALAREANAQRVAAERAAEERRREAQRQELEAKRLAEEHERKVNAERVAAEETRKAEEQEAAEAAQRRAAWARKQREEAEATGKAAGKGKWFIASLVAVLLVGAGVVGLRNGLQDKKQVSALPPGATISPPESPKLVAPATVRAEEKVVKVLPNEAISPVEKSNSPSPVKKPIIRPDDVNKLENIASIVTREEVRLEVIIATGAASSAKGSEANKRLSSARVNAVKNFFVSRGVAANRIYIEEYGDGLGQKETRREQALQNRVDVEALGTRNGEKLVLGASIYFD